MEINRNFPRWLISIMMKKRHIQNIQWYVGASYPDQLLSCVLVRPIDRIVLLVEMNEVLSSTEEP